MTDAEWMSAAQALERLGVRAQTLYAYVSRGRVEARSDTADPRRSLYRASDIQALALRKARGRRPADVARQTIAFGEPILASAITTVWRGRLYYRGQDAAALATHASLEETAEILWAAPAALAGAATGATTPAPGTTAKARAFAALAQRAGRDPPAAGRAPASLVADGAAVLGALADAMAGAVHAGPIHRRLATAWGADAAAADLIRRALVLTADHELNASTFAARVAASTGAALSASVLAGLSALSGPRHGGYYARVQAFFAEARAAGPHEAVAARLAQGVAIPGLGHPLYPQGDVRAQALLAAFTPAPDCEAARLAAEAATGQHANIDYALTALAQTLALPAEAPFVLFTVGRCAGWIAHALEQGLSRDIIRPRARYVGPPIG